MANEKDSLHEGDGILLFCSKAEGFIYSPPPLRPNVASVSIHSVTGNSAIQPGFSNVHYASFLIHPKKKDRGVSDKTNKELVFGRKVYLYHVASKWYLSFDGTNNANAKTATLVNSKPCASVFRIISSDPSKSTGQTIKAEDSVRLEIVDQPGEHSQVLCVPNKLSYNGFELRKASDGSDFTLYSQSTELKQGPPLALRGGEVVMFMNEKRDAFITIVKDGRVMAKVADGPDKGSIFTGGDSYWQVENAAVQYDGNWVDLGDPWAIRIKHLPSKRYLALVTDDEFNSHFELVEDGNDDDCTFHFEEDRLEPDTGLFKRRYTLLKHKDSFLTVDGSSSELIDGSRCFNIVPKPSTEAISDQRDRKFWIEEVDDEVLNKFAKLSGAFITLKGYLTRLEEAEMSQSGAVVALPTDTLKALAEWTTEEETGHGMKEKWPDMLRAIEGVELVLKFLKRPTDSTNQLIQRKLCIVLENFIKFASEDSQLYLISKEELLHTLFPLLGRGVGAENVLSALIRCRCFGSSEKEKVLETVFQPDIILRQILHEEKAFVFLKCLSALCMSGGRPEKKIQWELVEKVIIPGHKDGIFFRIGSDGSNVIVENPVMFQGVSIDSDKDLRDHLVQQILFYASVCEGVNIHCIEQMTKPDDGLITYNTANACLRHFDSHPAIQSAFYKYLVSSLVDKNAEESGTDLENIWCIYSWKRFVGSEDEAAVFKPPTLSGLANTHDIVSDKEEMVRVQNEIQETLEKTNWSRDIDEGREDLMTQKLHVLETLVAYGFYWFREVGKDVEVPSPGTVIKALIDILGYESKRDKQNLCKLQSKAIQVLNLFLYQTYHLASSRILFDFGYFNDTNSNLDDFSVPKSYFSDLLDENFQMSKLLPEHVDIPAVKKHVMKQKVLDAHHRLRWILYEERADTQQLMYPGQARPRQEYDYSRLNIYDEHSEPLKKLLMNFIASNDDELRLSAAKLFFDLYQGGKHLFQRANQSLIVMDTTDSWEIYTTMVKYATYQDKVQGEFIRSLLRLTQGKGLEPEVKKSIISFTNDAIAVSGTPPGTSGLFPRDETFTEKRGQDIVVTTGVFGVLLNYVWKYSIIDDSSQNELVNKVCDTLLSFVRNNNDTKRVVFERFHDLLQARQGVWSTAHLLTEVLTDNIHFCRELPQSTIRTMFRMAAIKDNVNRDYYEFIPTIEAWMKVGKMTPHLLKKHQRFVASLFEQFFKDYYESDWDPQTTPMEMLKEEDNDKFVLLVRLLAVCTEGIHKYSEDIARSIFKFSALTEIISNESIPFEKRLPFMSLINEAFIKTERESLLSVIDIAGDSKVWGHVELMTQWLTKMNEKLAAIKGNKKTVACQANKMRLIFSQHMTHLYWRDHKVFKINMKSSFKEEQVTLEDSGDSQPLAILYQYLIEGLVPMLSSFAEEYNSLWIQYKDMISSDSKPLRDTDKNLLMAFTNQLHEMVCSHPAVFVNTELQKDYWTYHLRLLLSLENNNPNMEFTLSVGPPAQEVSDSQEKKDEDAINNKFKIYLNNFRKMIYYSDDDGDKDAAALYPRGPGFQELVNFFLLQESEDAISTKIGHLVDLLRILYKDLQQSYDSKHIEAQTALTIQIIQVISCILSRTVPEDEDEDDHELVENKYKELKIRQEICLSKKVHDTCMLLLNLDNNEICIQVFGLLTFITLNANITAQDQVFEGVSSRDSLFCRRVYGLLEGVSETFRETWASKRTDRKQSQQAHEKQNGIEMEPVKKPELVPQASITPVYGGTLGVDSLEDTIRTAGIVLDCISALCDGQHKNTQRFLLDQDKSFKKLDIIKRVAILLDVLTEEYEKTLKFSVECSPSIVFNYLDLIQKAIQAIIETVAGNFENQEAVFQCQVTDTVNYLLKNLIDETLISTHEWSEEEQEEIQKKKRKLNEKAIELLQILLEETDKRSGALIANFTEDVDLEAIIAAMFYWEEIECYHILRLVSTCKDVSVDKLMYKRMQKWDNQQKDLWKDFKARSRCIEVLYEPDKQKSTKILTKVYFDFDPLDELPEEFKNTVSNAISEEALEKNLTEFNEWGRAIRKNAEHQYKFLHGNSWFWLFIYRLFYETSAPRNLLLGFLTVILNILTVAVFLVPANRSFNQTNTAPNFILYPDIPFWYFPVLLPILGLVHIVLSVWMYLEFIIKEYPNFTGDVFFVTMAQQLSQSFKRWVSQQEIFKNKCPKDWKLKQKQRKVNVKYTPDQEGDDVDEIIDDPNYEDPYYYEDDDDNEGYFKIDFFGFQSLYRLLFLACSIAAIPLRGYTYCICLFYVFLDVDVVQYILTALTRARKQLCFVFFISAGVLLVFAMAAFIFLHDYLEPSNTLFCNSLWECYITVTREGLLDTLGLAIPYKLDAQGDNVVPSYNNYAIRSLFFDIPFFIVVTTIILNIVTAVLIDRFSDLRGERDQVENNKKKACFICGIETEKFERNGKGFRDHVKEDHNKWNYIYYLIHLDRKNRNDLTALEKQIADNNGIDKKYGKTDHYPIEQAKVLPEDLD